VIIRRATPADIEALERIQRAAAEAAQWRAAEYLDHEVWIAGDVGFLVLRSVTPDEHEILNIAVLPEARRRGVARSLMARALAARTGTVFLEVRESNAAARAFYLRLGFAECGRRRDYYDGPREDAIVMQRGG
jgi:ribosomal-protein-alanine N-acetyltransferase